LQSSAYQYQPRTLPNNQKETFPSKEEEEEKVTECFSHSVINLNEQEKKEYGDD